MEDKNLNPTSIRLSNRARDALERILKHLQDVAPAGVRINVSEAIENAILEKDERITAQAPATPRGTRPAPKPGKEPRYEDNE